jgi:integrase
MALTDLQLRKMRPQDKIIKFADERGMYIELHPNGSMYWRLKYRFLGKEKRLALGVYPEVSLAEARDKRDAARKQLAEGVDPSAARRAGKAALSLSAENSFELVCREWLENRKSTVEPAQHLKTLARMENDVFPWLGRRPIADITAMEILSVLRRIDARGARYTAHRVRSEISRAFRFAVVTGRAERDPCPDLQGAIAPAKSENFPAITEPKEAAALLRALDAFEGTFIVKSALQLAPLVFVRPGELRKAEWKDINLEKGEWKYLVTKTRTDHLVPLAAQAISILTELHALTGRGRWVFPGRDPQKSMSNAAVNAALRRMGYDTKTEITGHGFRAMARTILAEELHIRPEVIEHQLAHKVPDALGTAYNRTKFLNERRVMMQQWADYLDQLKAGAEVLAFQSGGRASR